MHAIKRRYRNWINSSHARAVVPQVCTAYSIACYGAKYHSIPVIAAMRPDRLSPNKKQKNYGAYYSWTGTFAVFAAKNRLLIEERLYRFIQQKKKLMNFRGSFVTFFFTVCNQFSRGVFSMLGAVSPESFDTLHSYSNTFQMPFVTPWFPEKVSTWPLRILQAPKNRTTKKPQRTSKKDVSKEMRREFKESCAK